MLFRYWLFLSALWNLAIGSWFFPCFQFILLPMARNKATRTLFAISDYVKSSKTNFVLPFILNDELFWNLTPVIQRTRNNFFRSKKRNKTLCEVKIECCKQRFCYFRHLYLPIFSWQRAILIFFTRNNCASFLHLMVFNAMYSSFVSQNASLWGFFLHRHLLFEWVSSSLQSSRIH